MSRDASFRYYIGVGMAVFGLLIGFALRGSFSDHLVYLCILVAGWGGGYGMFYGNVFDRLYGGRDD